jgi:sugar phosphate isomerase/epimerase
MRISFHTCGLEWFSLEEAIRELADIGYAAFGPILAAGGHLDPDTITDSQKTEYRDLARECNIAFSILNPWKIGGFAAGADSGETERFFHQALDLAADLGAFGVKFLPGSLPSGENNGWRAMIEVLKPLCHHAEQVGVDLLIHNHENQLIDTANGFALLRHHIGSDRLQVNLDVANMAILMDDPCRAIRDFRDNLRCVRVKGMYGYYPFAQQCEPGIPGDIVDWEAVFLALKEVGYEGDVELVTYPWFSPGFPRSGYAWAMELAERLGITLHPRR